MFSTTHPSLADALKQARKEQPKQLAIVEGYDDVGQVVWIYSRPVVYMKD